MRVAYVDIKSGTATGFLPIQQLTDLPTSHYTSILVMCFDTCRPVALSLWFANPRYVQGTERHYRVGSTPLYCGSPEFKSQPGDAIIDIFRDFLQTFQTCWVVP